MHNNKNNNTDQLYNNILYKKRKRVLAEAASRIHEDMAEGIAQGDILHSHNNNDRLYNINNNNTLYNNNNNNNNTLYNNNSKHNNIPYDNNNNMI